MSPKQIISYSVAYLVGLYVMYKIIYNQHIWIMFRLSFLTGRLHVYYFKVASHFAMFETIFIMFFIFYMIFMVFLYHRKDFSRERLLTFNFFYWVFFGVFFFFFLLMYKFCWLG